jgi:nucleotidyltransferase substrate binding protein (TIGR01987 family)
VTKLQSLREDFESAVLRLEEVLEQSKTDYIRDAAIKRFEIAFDLAWKTIKAFLEERHSLSCVSPKSCLREAHRVGLIEYDAEWLTLADTRNLAAHTYREELAEKVYQELPAALGMLRKLRSALEK